MGKAVFLDRDGTIIEDSGHPHERDKIRFLPRASEAIALLNKNGFKVIVVTNQAGVARGYFTEETVKEINRHIQESLAQAGARIDTIYYCPHHVEGVIEQYRVECYCRKPNPGMIEQAARDFEIDLSSSFVIGDHMSDVQAGLRAGCRTVLLAEESHSDVERSGAILPDRVARNLYEAAEWVVMLGGRG
ncbi:MAG: HAD family hydrolase [Chloroflexi bacterium]|nr:HAD family hydrolase [Chloroflexota bacterium]